MCVMCVMKCVPNLGKEDHRRDVNFFCKIGMMFSSAGKQINTPQVSINPDAFIWQRPGYDDRHSVANTWSQLRCIDILEFVAFYCKCHL